MVENADNILVLNSQAAGKQPEQNATPAGQQQYEHTRITGRFNQYTSGYWALALPALATRYIGRYALGFFGIKDPNTFNPSFAGIVGLWMGAVTSFYAKRTYQDMQRVFSQTVAWESGKKPEEIGLQELWGSRNDIVHKTMRNYLFRNLMRVGVSASFFARFLPWKGFKHDRADSVDLGTGLTGGYLVSDVLFRKQTFFEMLQNIIDNKINHANTAGDVITPFDLANLYVRHERDINKQYRVPQMDSQQWRDDQALFARMATLMNETYHNAVNKEGVQFTIPKLLYLLGNGFINTRNAEQSLTFVEIAGRSKDMHEVKEASAALKSGVPLDEIMRRYGVTSPVAEDNISAGAVNASVPEAQEARKFTDTLAAEARNTMRDLAAANMTHAEKAMKGNDNNRAVPGVA